MEGKNLVIVESPGKVKTIQKYLGKEYLVKASIGHIRDLQEKKLGVDVAHGFQPEYVVPADKKKVVTELKKLSSAAQTVWLASDEDREGEAISWHLSETLGLDPAKTRRIVFHEITKPAILEAIQHPRDIDRNLVDAQQARRVLDRLVGFELSPVLWRKIQPKLSAGRVQSVALRLIVDREKEIIGFHNEPYYRVEALFHPEGTPATLKVKALLDTRFPSEEEARKFLEDSIGASYRIDSLEKKEATRFPAPPFTTSTLQQEASRKLHFPVATTMRVAQTLYERGLITYMRTDSVNLSTLALGTARKFILENFGEEYSHTRQYRTKTKGAQEAHEAIRPTFIENATIDGTAQEKKLYELIWKRTVASQMSESRVMNTSIRIASDKRAEHYAVQASEMLFDGFMKVYLEGRDDEDPEEGDLVLPELHVDDRMDEKGITAQCKYTAAPPRYSQATLVKKLEELEIGRPSTYATIITTLTTGRGYVVNGDKEGTKIPVKDLYLKGGALTEKQRTETVGAERGKLLPQEIGVIVSDYLVKNFSDIMDYDFTATVEKDFDEIADGKKQWRKVIDGFYVPFHKNIRQTQQSAQRTTGSRLLGTDPKSGKNVYAKIGRYGTLVQIGETNTDEKPLFASMKKGQSIENITLEEALELFNLPRTLGSYEDKDVIVSIGKFGPYVRHNGKFYSLGKNDDPYEITLERAIEIVDKKREAEAKKEALKKDFPHEIGVHDGEAVVSNIGRFGPYLTYHGENFRLPKNIDPLTLSLDDAMGIIQNASKKKTKTKK